MSTLRRLLAGLAVLTGSVLPLSGVAVAEPRPIHADLAAIETDDAVSPSLSPTTPRPLLRACPIDGPATFEDSWGWARSGGRRHQGVDIIADRGIPVLAVRDGSAHFKDSRLGGRSIWLTTDDGDRFFYAHLDAWEGSGRDVVAGEVIGYVGSTGNAHGPHLHFEVHPDGRVENPYPHTVGACVPRGLTPES